MTNCVPFGLVLARFSLTLIHCSLWVWLLWFFGSLVTIFDEIYADIDVIKTVNITEYPFMVSIFYRRGYIIQRCTGTFITNMFILSSGICYQKFYRRAQERYAIYGTNTPSRHVNNQEYKMGLSCGFLHPDYSGSEMPNDIALLRLTDRVDNKKQIFGAVCIPPFENSECTEPQDCFSILFSIAKTGIPVLARLKMAIIEQENCKKDYGELDKDRQLCARMDEGVRANSLMTSGAALLCHVKNNITGEEHDVQIGVVNFDSDSVISPNAGIYANTPYFREWMVKIVNKYKVGC